MQTFFNPTTPFFDDEGHPLVWARVSFLEIGTSANFIDLTDSEGTPLPNPLFTGSDGRLRLNNGNGAPAVPCIANGLSYKVVVAKKTGVEPIFVDGILQNPEELYEEPSIVFVVTAMGGSGAGGNSSVVGSIAEVRSADKGLGSVVCAGYYAAGDCPSRTFTWFDSEEPPEDNGINILRNPDDNTGYWKMGDPQAGTWDVRMAGLRPEFESSTNSSLLANLLSMVNDSGFDTMSTRIFFPKGVWKIQQGFTAYSKVVFGYGAKLAMGNGSAKTFNFHGGIESFGSPDAGNLKIFEAPYGGYLKIVCGLGVFRSSWLGNVPLSNLSVKDTFIIDSDDRDFPHTGARMVIVETDLAHTVDFRDCEIVSAGHLGNGSFRNCKLRGAMFLDSDLDSVFVDEDCVIHAKDFHGRMPLWCKLRSQQHDPVLDLEMETLDSSCMIALDGVFFKDALFDGFVHDATASVGFDGCSGSLELNFLGDAVVSMEDSELLFALKNTGANGNKPAFVVNGGSFGNNGFIAYLSSFGAKNAQVSGYALIVSGDVGLDNCSVTVPFTVNGAFSATYCNIAAGVNHSVNTQQINLTLKGNRLSGTYSIGSSVAGTIVNALIEDNYSNATTAIDIVRNNNIDPIDNHHSYTYKGNCGTFLPDKTKPVAHEFTVKQNAAATNFDPYTLLRHTTGSHNHEGWIRPANIYQNNWFDEVEFFRIGIDRIKVKASLPVYPGQIFVPENGGELASYHDALLGAYFIEGNKWGIQPYWDDPVNAWGGNATYNYCFFRSMLTTNQSGPDYTLSMEIQYENLESHG